MRIKILIQQSLAAPCKIKNKKSLMSSNNLWSKNKIPWCGESWGQHVRWMHSLSPGAGKSRTRGQSLR